MSASSRKAYHDLPQDEHAIHNLTPDMVQLASESNLFKRLSLIFQRVFLPRITIARIYQIPTFISKGYRDILRLKDFN